ncbi:MAG: hypothetical protein DDG59_13725 [Anaerolineae bacterium]|nr:MAG: hypothetical protein DDG59_13725 [Anaerolineae bacterium]
MTSTIQPRSNSKSIAAWLILTVAALNGLVYLFLVPPWQHYDEPGHFEYVWLFSRLEHVPTPDDVDYAFRRELSASMVEHDFFRDMGWTPNLIDLDQAAWIGISQTDDQPLYYFLASLPLRLVSNVDVTVQLYLARMVSWGLFIFTVWVGKKASEEWFGKQHDLAILIPLFLATLPGFVDLMTAVNNDVGAIAFASIFFWMAGSLIVGKLSFWRLLLFILSVVLCYFTKATAWIVIPLTPLALILAVPLRKRLEWTRFALIGILMVAGITLAFDRQKKTPLFFYSNSLVGLRSEFASAPVGRRIFVIEQGSSLRQAIPLDDLKKLRGKAVTVGAWMWAKENSQGNFLELIIDGKSVGEKKEISLTTQPQFFRRYYLIPSEAQQGWLVLSTDNLIEGTQLYIDGIVMAEGLYISSETPHYANAQASAGSWQGNSFRNLVRNGSAEVTVPVLSDLSSRWLSKGRINPVYFWSIVDIKGVGWFYAQSLQSIFRTFWGQFGWAHVPLVGKWSYDVLFGLTILVFCGIVLSILQQIKGKWRLLTFFTISILIQLSFVLLRGELNWDDKLLLPVARYFLPAILPLSSALCTGIDRILIILSNEKRFSPFRIWLFVNLLLMLTILAWFSIYEFYYGGI